MRLLLNNKDSASTFNLRPYNFQGLKFDIIIIYAILPSFKVYLKLFLFDDILYNTTPFNEWYEQNKYSLPAHSEESFSDNVEYLFFLQNVYRKATAVLQPALYTLMLQHYPVFTKETRPSVLKHINEIAE